MEIIQEKGFGEEGSAMERYFAHLEQVYERNSVQGCQLDSITVSLFVYVFF